MMAKGNYIGKFLLALLAIGITWMLAPKPRGLVYEVAPDNAQVLLDYLNHTWVSPPCLLTGRIEPNTLSRIRKFMTDDSELGRAARDVGEKMGVNVATSAAIDIELATMSEAHSLRQKNPQWHPDDKCNDADGFIEEKTFWGWVTGRPGRWTADGQWRW